VVQPAADQQPDGLLEAGMAPAVWHNGQTLAGFISSVFPRRDFPSLGGGGPGHGAEEVSPSAKIQVASITARRLKKVAHLDIVPTDDLRNHLVLDEKKGTVAVFSYTSVLKEHLAAAAAAPPSRSSSLPSPSSPSFSPSSSFSTCCYSSSSSPSYDDEEKHPRPAAAARSGIPRALALETLATLKEVLFPDDDATSHAALRRTLVAARSKSQRLDPDVTRVVDYAAYNTTTTTAAAAAPMTYPHWGARLMDLHDELENPAPRGLLWTWMERRSGARYVSKCAGWVFFFFGVFCFGLTACVLCVNVFADHCSYSDGYAGWRSDCSGAWNIGLGCRHIPGLGQLAAMETSNCK
jgi:hypothetical protein